VRYSSIQITRPKKDPTFWYKATIEPSTVTYLRKNYKFLESVHNGVELYMDPIDGVVAVIPEFHPLFNCEMFDMQATRRGSAVWGGTQKVYNDLHKLFQAYVNMFVEVIPD
jgi:hypothetical protein